MSKKGIKQAFRDVEYIPERLKSKDLKLLRQDYTRLRDIMQKRYKRIEKAGFKTNFTKWVKSAGGIPKISELKKLAGKDQQQLKNELAYWLSELKRFESEKDTKVSELKKTKKGIIDKLQENGFNIKEDQYHDFMEYLDYIHVTDLDRIVYDATFHDLQDVGYKPEAGGKKGQRTEKQKNNFMDNFNLWLKNGKSLPDEFFIRR